MIILNRKERTDDITYVSMTETIKEEMQMSTIKRSVIDSFLTRRSRIRYNDSQLTSSCVNDAKTNDWEKRITHDRRTLESQY